MTTKHETAMAALAAALGAGMAVPVTRDQALPESIPAAGLADLRGGTPAELDRRLSPEMIEWQLDAELVLIASGPARRATIEALSVSAGAAIVDRTLGGAVDWVEIGAPDPVPESAIPGAATVRGVSVTFQLFYETGANPLED